MSFARRAIIISALGNAVTVFPLLLLHGFRLVDAAGIFAITTIFGALAGVRATWQRGLSLSQQRILVAKFALFMPVVLLVIHALVLISTRYFDSKPLTPDTPLQRLAVVSALAAFLCWFGYFHYIERKHKSA